MNERFHSLLPQAGAETEGRSLKNKCIFFRALRDAVRGPSAERNGSLFFLPRVPQLQSPWATFSRAAYAAALENPLRRPYCGFRCLRSLDDRIKDFVIRLLSDFRTPVPTLRYFSGNISFLGISGSDCDCIP